MLKYKAHRNLSCVPFEFHGKQGADRLCLSLYEQWTSSRFMTLYYSIAIHSFSLTRCLKSRMACSRVFLPSTYSRAALDKEMSN